jgi:hypothetical protein
MMPELSAQQEASLPCQCMLMQKQATLLVKCQAESRAAKEEAATLQASLACTESQLRDTQSELSASQTEVCCMAATYYMFWFMF